MQIRELKETLEAAGIRPNTLAGQHFLVDDAVQGKISEAADPRGNETVLEIGPGLGALTFALSEKAKRVVAVEKDQKLFGWLKKEINARGLTNIELIHDDILALNEESFTRIAPYKVVANIPYYLTARLIRKLLAEVTQPEEMFLAIQKEVAERIIARPPRMNLLALSVQAYSSPQILFYIPRRAFWPMPEVDSAFIKIGNISRTRFGDEDVRETAFFKVARAAFGTKRKMLINSIEKVTHREKAELAILLEQHRISQKARPEELSVEAWLELIHALEEKIHVRW